MRRDLNIGEINRQLIHGDGCSESDHQRALVQWARHSAPLQKVEVKRLALEFFHSIPNSGAGSGKTFTNKSGVTFPPRLAVALKLEGLVPGIGDLKLDFGRGLVIEMKAAGEQLSKAQEKYFRFMRMQGCRCEGPVYTWQAGAYSIVEYMRLEVFAPIWELRGSTMYKITSREFGTATVIPAKMQ